MFVLPLGGFAPSSQTREVARIHGHLLSDVPSSPVQQGPFLVRMVLPHPCGRSCLVNDDRIARQRGLHCPEAECACWSVLGSEGLPLIEGEFLSCLLQVLLGLCSFTRGRPFQLSWCVLAVCVVSLKVGWSPAWRHCPMFSSKSTLPHIKQHVGPLIQDTSDVTGSYLSVIHFIPVASASFDIAEVVS